MLKMAFCIHAMIYGNTEIVSTIKDFIKEKRKEKKIVNRVLKEDIFPLLENECVLLYYPLKDENIKGIHVEKVVGNEVKQFVFINTIKNTEEQTWTAAHELGHVWKVDDYVIQRHSIGDVSKEDIVNRFASELLFPEEEFKREYFYILKKTVHENMVSKAEFIGIITYLMNAFCAPYKATIRRLVELGYIERKYENLYIEQFGNSLDIYENVIKENYYSRLNKKSEATSISNISADIDLLEKYELVSSESADRYRNLFSIKKEKEEDETFILGGQNGEK